MKNPLGKARGRDKPYAIFKQAWPDGELFGRDSEVLVVTHRLLKTYQLPKNERKNKYARWFLCSTSAATSEHGDMGDMYAHDTTSGAVLQYASPEFVEAYANFLFDNAETGETKFLWQQPEIVLTRPAETS